MRAVKAKHLRNVARALGEGLPVNVSNNHPQRPKKIFTGELNEDGTQKFIIITPIVRKLGDCQRKIYQDLKRLA
jgi:hypothetical protein